MEAKEALEITKRIAPQTAVEIMPGLSLKRTKGGIPVTRIHYTAMPERNNPEWKAKERKSYTSQADWDREQEIVDEAGGGQLVFADTLITYWNKIVITDPMWRPDPMWGVIGGFDHGRTNPTSLERLYTDFDGNHYVCGEYYVPDKSVWQHAPEILKMPDVERLEVCWSDPTVIDQKTQQAAGEDAKAIADVYRDHGVGFLSRFGGNRNDQTFAERLLAHWANLHEREPSLRIVCRNTSDRPQIGMHPWDCPNLIWELLRARRAKLSAQQLLTRNVSEQIVDKDNHAIDCFVAGTSITTRSGETPIEDIRVGDEILTREGWRPAVAAWKTHHESEIWKVTLDNDVELFCTGTHPIWIEGSGFLQVDALKYGMMCSCVKTSTAKPSIRLGWGSNSVVIQTAHSPTFATTGAQMSGCIPLSGFLSIGSPFRQSIISTTEIQTASTMTLRILRLFSEPFTLLSHGLTKLGLRGENTWLKSATGRQHGTDRQKVERGTRRIAGDNLGHWLTKCVRNAARSFRTRIAKRETRSVLALAGPNGVMQIDSITNNDHASAAANRSPAGSMRRLGFALASVRVRSVEKTPLRLPVYNLTVAGTPEYFANGVLVHNCLKYMVMSLPEPTQKSRDMRIQEAMKPHWEQGDMTSAHLAAEKIRRKIDEEDDPFQGSNARQQLRRMGMRRSN